MISDKLFRLIPTPQRILPEFLAIVFGSRTVRTQIERAISGASGLANNIGKATVKDFRVALPPIPEQMTILADIRSSGRKTENLLASIDAAVAHLLELRTALISAAVTGKIDVRENSA